MKVKNLYDIPPMRTYLVRIGAEPRSLRTAVVKETEGKYWRDLAVIRLSHSGEIVCTDAEYAPTDFERSAVLDACSKITWPKVLPLKNIVDPPPLIRNSEKRDIYEFRGEDGLICMVQVRMEKAGEKSYVPWTYWDDNIWRLSEPDGPLPLYNGHRLKDASTVFIHEGAKAARYMQRMVDAETRAAKDDLREHPWGSEISGAIHLGWIGGAMSPYRTDWTPIKKAGVRRAYIVADNDEPGRTAVPAIAQALRCPTFMIQFTDEFPASFDLADRFPTKMFGGSNERMYYVGPSFRECLHPATWATDIVPPPNGKGRPVTVLRESFKGMWAYVEEADLFVCTEMPEILRSEAILNKMLAPFSHVAETTRLIVKKYHGRSARVCYRPDHPGLVVTFKGSSAINLHTPTNIKSSAGDPKIWNDFLDYMFINTRERHEAARWCATLIARPEVRMGYGLLLISERQGIGKTTLGAAVLAPLVGLHNVGYPGEDDITAPFNDWVAHKRLAIVNEIYSGSSWKAYHALKSIITDREITVNQKYMRQYIIDNWCHILACSNSMRALKMENDDRRWYYPEVTEVPWPKTKFDEFRNWLELGGLQIVKHWAENFGDYVQPAERAPMTDRKREMIEGSRSEAQQEAVAIAEVLKDFSQPAGLILRDIVGWCRAKAQGKVHDSDYEIKRAMVQHGEGLEAWSKRIKVYGRLEYLVINAALLDMVQRSDDPSATLRGNLVKVSDIMEREM